VCTRGADRASHGQSVVTLSNECLVTQLPNYPLDL
jgi:hypothetical protein